jgi:putative hydrolase of the HAD superfamily
MIELIAFDADDTLWHNEPLFGETKRKFSRILTAYHSAEWIEGRLDETEIRNLARYGYGIKAFALSMIETAIELTEGRITGAEVREVMGLAWEMLHAPLELLPGVRETVEELAAAHRLMVITKGDLFEQEAKIARSGLGDFFTHIEIVSEKTPLAYEKIVARYGVRPGSFLMVGNSLRFDILPVIEIGGRAAHVPYRTTWFHETVPESELVGKEFSTLERISDLAALIATLRSR